MCFTNLSMNEVIYKTGTDNLRDTSGGTPALQSPILACYVIFPTAATF